MFSNLLRVCLLCSVSPTRLRINQVDANECGQVHLLRELVLGGNEVLRGEWPFIAALYHTKQLNYFCGGTIISNKHVLTAAHCIQGKFSNKKLSPNEVRVRLGAYNLTSNNESSIVDRNVSHIHLHPDWNVHDEKYDADVAILILSDNVTYSNHIRPICMPVDDVSIDGIKGTVVGWGITENGTFEGIPRQMETIALNDSYCYRTDNGISRYSSERSFCGGGTNDTPNKGDSGGGLFAVFGSTWVQYGTVSVVRANATGQIVASSFAIYMNVKLFKNWIADIVAQSGGVVSEATMKINLHCFYGYDTENVYGCWLYNLDIRKEYFMVNTTSGLHKFENTDADVDLIYFQNGTMFFLPLGFGRFFQNLTYLTVGNGEVSLGTKRIRRSNFQNLENMKEIRLLENDIDELDEDSLWDLPNLQVFQIELNKLKTLHAKTFSTNYQLRTVYILLGALKSLPTNLFQNNSLLEVVALDGNSFADIDERLFETNTKLRQVYFSHNSLEVLSNNLFRNNAMLEKVSFESNAIKTIEENTFELNPNLRTVYLASNNLESLPRHLFRTNTFLKVIDFSNNSIKSIDELLFRTNIRVREIYLRSNHLNNLPDNLFFSNLFLETLDLSKNFLNSIHENFFQTNSLLRKITLASNSLVDLPRNLFINNESLEFVNVRNNFLDAINEELFVNNVKLKQVFVEGNDVKIFSGKLFQTNLLLEIVDFANNSLDTIDEKSFQTNVKLREVYLWSNFLQFLPKNLFRNNLLLEVVNLSKNFLKTIDENTFSTNSRLRKVVLEFNKLEFLPKNLFQSNLLLEVINVRRNSLKNIDIVFTDFKNVFFITFYKNQCIDASFFNIEDDLRTQYYNVFKNLGQFQDLVMANCSYANSLPHNQ